MIVWCSFVETPLTPDNVKPNLFWLLANSLSLCYQERFMSRLLLISRGSLFVLVFCDTFFSEEDIPRCLGWILLQACNITTFKVGGKIPHNFTYCTCWYDVKISFPFGFIIFFWIYQWDFFLFWRLYFNICKKNNLCFHCIYYVHLIKYDLRCQFYHCFHCLYCYIVLYY